MIVHSVEVPDLRPSCARPAGGSGYLDVGLRLRRDFLPAGAREVAELTVLGSLSRLGLRLAGPGGDRDRPGASESR